ncbi:MAG: hypothetical protein QXT38_03205 [Candidatus Aenigmatarchaeota archaeon]
MKWKILFLLFLVFLIGSILFLNKEKIKIPKFESITGFITKVWRSQEKKIALTIYELKNPLTFPIFENMVNLNGSCTIPIKIGKTSIHLANYKCDLKFYEPNGKITLNQNLVSFEIDSKSFEINGIFYQTEEKIKGEILIDSGNFFVQSSNIQMKEIEGKLEIYTAEDKPSLIVNFPPCEYLEINNFNGEVVIRNNSITFIGISSGKYRCQNVENKI